MYIVKVRKSYGNTYAVYTCSESVYNKFGSIANVPIYLCAMNICSVQNLGKITEDWSCYAS